MKNTVVAVVSSEKTFNRLDQILFNDAFLQNRDKFDLAVVFNTNTEIEINFRTNLDLIYFRENVGLDPGGFNYLIQHLPEYEYYFLLHDDHFFLNPNWFDISINLLEENLNVDIIGNILFNQLPTSLQKLFDEFIISLKLDHILGISKSPHFIHGIAGIYRKKAIVELKKKYGSIPFIQSNDKLLAMFCERLASLLFSDCSLYYSQFPGEIFTFLIHTSINYLSIYFSEGSKYLWLKDFDKSISYFENYIQLANQTHNLNDIHLAYAHLCFIYKIKNNLSISKKYFTLLTQCNITTKFLNEIIDEFDIRDIAES